jgi:hypothetical protein
MHADPGQQLVNSGQTLPAHVHYHSTGHPNLLTVPAVLPRHVPALDTREAPTTSDPPPSPTAVLLL